MHGWGGVRMRSTFARWILLSAIGLFQQRGQRKSDSICTHLIHPSPYYFFFFLHKLLARSQLPHCCSLHQKWKLCLLCTKWQTPHVPYEKGVNKTHAGNIKEGQRWCFGNEDFSKWGKQKIKVIVTVTAVYSNGQITNKYSHYQLVLSLPEWVKSPK